MAKQNKVAQLSDTELDEALSNAKAELFNLRFQHATGTLENYSRLREVRREVARVNTELRVREIAAAEAIARKEMA
ncbi:MAG: 50S ribosomal protein L29 [Acidimicrobiia bacterium]